MASTPKVPDSAIGAVQTLVDKGLLKYAKDLIKFYLKDDAASQKFLNNLTGQEVITSKTLASDVESLAKESPKKKAKTGGEETKSTPKEYIKPSIKSLMSREIPTGKKPEPGVELGPKQLTAEDFEGPASEPTWAKQGPREQQYLNRPDSPQFLLRQTQYRRPLGPEELSAEMFEEGPTGVELSSGKFRATPSRSVEFPSLAPKEGQITEAVAAGTTPLRQQDRTDWAAAEEAGAPNKLVPYKDRLPEAQAQFAESEYIPPKQPGSSLEARGEQQPVVETEISPTGEKRKPWSKYTLGAAAGTTAAGLATMAALSGGAKEAKQQPEGTGQAAKAATPAQVPVGGESTKPSETKPTEGLSASQGKLKAAIDKVASGKSKTVPEDKLETLTKSLDDVEKSVPVNSPAKSDLLQLRAEAYKLYKEKADRNEWMDVAERALNAIGQLASARAATGQQVGGLPLSRTDYGARTEQAFREYQADVGLAGEKVRAEEREAERLQAAREKEIARRRGTIEERIKTERQARAEAGDTERARIAAAAREDVARMRGAQPRVPTQEIKGVDAEIKTTMEAIKSANRFAAAADDKAAKASLGGFLTATGLTPEEVDAEVKSRSAGLFTGPSKKEARQQFAAERVQELRDRLDELRSQRDTLVTGQGAAEAAAAPAPTAPAGQPAAESDMVIAQIPGNQPMKLTREAATRAKQKYPNLIITPVR